MSRPLYSAAILLACCASLPAQVRADELADLVNAYRAAPVACAGHAAASMPQLTPERALSQVRVSAGTFLESALEQLGYQAEHAEALAVTGPANAAGAMDALRERYCDRLLSSEFSAIGTAHHGNEWQVVLGRPLVFPVLPDWQQAGQQLVTLVNAARAQPRRCGEQSFGAARPVSWNPALAEAAFAHSADMARRRYFSHREPNPEPNGSEPVDRAARAGYRSVHVGENIASGPHSMQEVMTTWLDSPGHCANIMDPGFRDMGAAYVIDPDSRTHTPYWTQVFGGPY
jgi:uncharacterized protein YkwD